MKRRLDRFIKDHQLPVAFTTIIDAYYVPLARWLYRQGTTGNGQANRPFVAGINGAQGTGKSTLSEVLKIILEENHGWQVAILSLDDIYLTRAERNILAQTIHPLLQTRGVPGTHDTSLGIEIIEQLKHLKPGQAINLPRFDKARDDREPAGMWETFTGPPDLIIFEGWCVGAVPMNADELVVPVNDFEAKEDEHGRWRRYINHQLQTSYRDLFAHLDLLIMLKAPGWDSIYQWRLEQEQKLAASSTAAYRIMNEQALLKFMQHYERLTLHNLNELPDRADVVLTLNRHHNVVSANYKKNGDHHE
jgi:D-glycerate 3-kinase